MRKSPFMLRKLMVSLFVVVLLLLGGWLCKMGVSYYEYRYRTVLVHPFVTDADLDQNHAFLTFKKQVANIAAQRGLSESMLRAMYCFRAKRGRNRQAEWNIINDLFPGYEHDTDSLLYGISAQEIILLLGPSDEHAHTTSSDVEGWARVFYETLNADIGGSYYEFLFKGGKLTSRKLVKWVK